MSRRRRARGRPAGRAPAPAAKPWLFGPAPDLLLGCGGLYIVLFGVMLAAGATLQPHQPEWVFPFLVLLFSMPHYGATLVRVYERRQDRRAYALFSVWATLAIGLAFVAGVHSRPIGALLFTLYLTWSPWHYTGQNYGITLMFLRRRGVEIQPADKRLIYANFIFSYVLFFLVVHGPERAAANGVAGYLSPPDDVVFLPLGIPNGLVDTLLPMVAVAYLATLALAAGRLLRRASPGVLLPSALLVLTQAVWFSLPYALQQMEATRGFHPFDPRFAAYYLAWIAIAHALQYLWVTSYYARGSGAWTGFGRHYARVMLAGAGVWFVPWLLFAPGALGRLATGDGMLAPAGASWWVLAAAVNLHHFVLDGAIWKLRNHKIAAVLIRSTKADEDPAEARPGVGGRLTWAAAAAALVIAVVSTFGRSVAFPSALERGEPERAVAILDGLAFLGQDMSVGRMRLGSLMEERGRIADALAQYERSAALDPSAQAWGRVGSMRRALGDFEGAARAFEAGLALQPDAPDLIRERERIRQARVQRSAL